MKKLFPLYAVIFIGYLGISMIVILFTTLLLNPSESIVPTSWTFKERSMMAGLLIAMYPLGQFLGQPFIGRLSDFFGRKKVLCLSLTSSTLLYFFIGFSVHEAMIALIPIALFFLGLSEGNVVIAQSIISEMNQEKKDRIKQFGMISIIISLSLVVGPILVAHFTSLPIEFYSKFSVPFFAVGFCISLLLVYITLFFHYPHVTKKEESYSFKIALVTIHRHRKLWPYFFANLLIYMAFSGIFRLYPLYLTDKFHLSTFELSRAIAINGIGFIVANTFLSPMLKRFLPANVLKWMLWLVSLCTLLILAQNHLYPTIIMTMITAAAIGICSIFALEIISQNAPKESLGEVLGNNSSLSTLSQVFVSLLGAYLLTIDQMIPMIMSAFFALVSGLIYLKISSRIASQ
jgi:MFS family permease